MYDFYIYNVLIDRVRSGYKIDNFQHTKTQMVHRFENYLKISIKYKR